MRGERLKDYLVDWEALRDIATEHGFMFEGGTDSYLMLDSAGLGVHELQTMLAVLGPEVTNYTAVVRYLKRTEIGDPDHTVYFGELVESWDEGMVDDFINYLQGHEEETYGAEEAEEDDDDDADSDEDVMFEGIKEP